MVKNLGLIVVALFLVFMVSYFTRSVQQETDVYKAKLDSLQVAVDSLENEIFIHSTNVTRYEIAVDRLKEQDPKAADKFEKCLSNIE